MVTPDPIRPALGRNSELQELYAQHWVELCSYLRKRFGAGPPEPEDVAQEAFIRFGAHASSHPIANARAYLFRTAHNILIDEHRHRACRAGPRLAGELNADSSDDLTPERVLVGQERLELLVRVIQAMPSARRRSLLLNRLHGLSCAAIARMTGYSESAVKKHLAVALTDLEAECAFAEQYTQRQAKRSRARI